MGFLGWVRWALAFASALVVLAAGGGCTAYRKGWIDRERLREEIREDQGFTVETVPEGLPAYRVASLRLAAEGYRAMQEGRVGEAEDKLEAALSRDPRNGFCYFYLAHVRFRKGEIRQALILLDQAEVLFQDHPYWLGEVYANRGRYWKALNRMDRARAAYAKALEYNPWNQEARKGLEELKASDG